MIDHVGHSEMAVVIEGHSLSVALEAANQETFLRLCQICRTVVCCRVTPLQKVQVFFFEELVSHSAILFKI